MKKIGKQILTFALSFALGLTSISLMPVEKAEAKSNSQKTYDIDKIKVDRYGFWLRRIQAEDPDFKKQDATIEKIWKDFAKKIEKEGCNTEIEKLARITMEMAKYDYVDIALQENHMYSNGYGDKTPFESMVLHEGVCSDYALIGHGYLNAAGIKNFKYSIEGRDHETIFLKMDGYWAEADYTGNYYTPTPIDSIEKEDALKIIKKKYPNENIKLLTDKQYNYYKKEYGKIIDKYKDEIEDNGRFPIVYSSESKTWEYKDREVLFAEKRFARMSYVTLASKTATEKYLSTRRLINQYEKYYTSDELKSDSYYNSQLRILQAYEKNLKEARKEWEEMVKTGLPEINFATTYKNNDYWHCFGTKYKDKNLVDVQCGIGCYSSYQPVKKVQIEVSPYKNFNKKVAKKTVKFKIGNDKYDYSCFSKLPQSDGFFNQYVRNVPIKLPKGCDIKKSYYIRCRTLNKDGDYSKWSYPVESEYGF